MHVGQRRPVRSLSKRQTAANSLQLLHRAACQRPVRPNRKRSRQAMGASDSQGAGAAAHNLKASEEVLHIWRTAQAVCFDVDSTLCEDESIDELAEYLGKGAAVAALTADAMSGSMKFEEALASRLTLMQVTFQKMEDFIQQHPPRLSRGIRELTERLQERGTAVYLVSGGFRSIINPIADMLSIPRDHVYANTILYNEDGAYSGFDANEFTSKSGGKPEAIKAIKAQHGYSPLVMVGDGATDAEAKQPGGADLFIGYGGVVHRPSVEARADWYVFKIQQLLDAM